MKFKISTWQAGHKPEKVINIPVRARNTAVEALSQYDPIARYMIQQGNQAMMIFTLPEDKYRVLYYDGDADEHPLLQMAKDLGDEWEIEFDQYTAMSQVIYFLEKNVYNFDFEWLPIEEFVGDEILNNDFILQDIRKNGLTKVK